eukprot:1152042-Pelagomonas_calceolata.AAC.5
MSDGGFILCQGWREEGYVIGECVGAADGGEGNDIGTCASDAIREMLLLGMDRSSKWISNPECSSCCRLLNIAEQQHSDKYSIQAIAARINLTGILTSWHGSIHDQVSRSLHSRAKGSGEGHA